MKKKLLALFALVAAVTAARAETRAVPQDAEELVKSAVAYVKRHGEFKAFREYENRSGPFVFRDAYIEVFDSDGRTLSNGGDPRKAGVALSALPESEQAGIRARLASMQGKESSWTDYDVKNPATGKVEPRSAYSERVGKVIVSSSAVRSR